MKTKYLKLLNKHIDDIHKYICYSNYINENPFLETFIAGYLNPRYRLPNNKHKRKKNE